MQMIEDVEEGILVSLTCKILDVIHDEHVYFLVEAYEISQPVLLEDGIHILGLELISGNIKHREFRMLFFDGIAYGLSQVSLAKSRAAEYEQGIERGLARLLGNVLAGGNAEMIALAVHQSAEPVLGIESRVYPELSLFLKYYSRFA